MTCNLYMDKFVTYIHLQLLQTKQIYKAYFIAYSVPIYCGLCIMLTTHFQFFLSSRAVYLLLWTARNGYENGGLEFWLSSIQCHAPKAPVFIVGTHADKVRKYQDFCQYQMW